MHQVIVLALHAPRPTLSWSLELIRRRVLDALATRITAPVRAEIAHAADAPSRVLSMDPCAFSFGGCAKGLYYHY